MNKAYLINSKKRKIEDIEIGDYRDIQRHIGCDCFTTGGSTPQGDTVYVDDEGLLNGTDEFFFHPEIYPHPLAGNAVVIGFNPNTGEDENVGCDKSFIEHGVKFFSRVEVALMVGG